MRPNPAVNRTDSSPQHRTIADDTKLESHDVDDIYARYLETCRRLGVEPVSLERAHELFDEWNDAINHAPPTQH